MIEFSYGKHELEYMTGLSSCCDIKADLEFYVCIAPGETKTIPTGIRIKNIDLSDLPPRTVPELQIRARSSLAKNGIFLANGVGTVDIDYRDEIMVALYNSTKEDFYVLDGNRIAQMTLCFTHRLSGVKVGGGRTGGFGSTGA